MRKQFQISQEEMAEIIHINQTTTNAVMYLSGGVPLGRSKQDAINDYWKELGKKHGFDWTTVEPIDDHNFTAEVTDGTGK